MKLQFNTFIVKLTNVLTRLQILGVL